jgi:hypothetical protein
MRLALQLGLNAERLGHHALRILCLKRTLYVVGTLSPKTVASRSIVVMVGVEE